MIERLLGLAVDPDRDGELRAEAAVHTARLRASAGRGRREAFQATSAGALFQVASQFNCLESPGRYVTRVVNYFDDNTQGPRASISAFPGTLFRHYAAPGSDGRRFLQETDGAQIDLLADACGPGLLDNSYFTGKDLGDMSSRVRALEDRFEAIRVGVHDDVEAVLGYDWDGAVDAARPRHIAQVFTSTVAGGWYGGETHLGGELFELACRHLLRTAYVGTLLSAVSLKRRVVVLTLIGGGVFGSPVPLIWDSILWALDQVDAQFGVALDVVVNGRSIGQALDRDAVILPAARARGGAVLAFDVSGGMTVWR